MDEVLLFQNGNVSICYKGFGIVEVRTWDNKLLETVKKPNWWLGESMKQLIYREKRESY